MNQFSPQVKSTSGLAIASIILAFLVPVVGMILGFIASSKAKKNGQSVTLPTISWIIGLVGTLASIVVGLIIILSIFNLGATNKKFLKAVFNKDYDTACSLYGAESVTDLADCRSLLEDVNSKYSGYRVVKISKSSDGSVKLQANLVSTKGETSSLGAAVVVDKVNGKNQVTNFIYGASTFENDTVSKGQTGSNTKASTLNPLYDSTPASDDTYKTPCFRYDIPKPHGPVPVGTICTGDNIFSSPDNKLQYRTSVQGYGPFDDYNTLDKCYAYEKKLIEGTDSTIVNVSDATWGGQKAKKFVERFSSSFSTGVTINGNYIVTVLPSPLDDTGFASASGGYIQYQCFVFSLYSDNGEDTSAVFNDIISSWIWR